MRSTKRKTKCSSSSSCEESPVDTKNMADISKVQFSDQLDAISKRLDDMPTSPKFIEAVKNTIEDSFKTLIQQISEKIDKKLEKFEHRVYSLELKTDELIYYLSREQFSVSYFQKGKYVLI